MLTARRADRLRRAGRVVRQRLRRSMSGTLVVAATGALLGSAFGLGATGQAPDIFDGHAWLWSRPAGEVARVNGGSGTVELRQPVVDSRGHRVQVTQDDRFLILHDLDTGRVSSIDLSRMGFSGSAATDPASDVTMALSEEDAVLIDRTRGLVRPLDPATLQARGEPVQLPAPLTGGVFDGTGALWLGLPSQGTVVALAGSDDGMSVTRTVPVADPGHDLALSVLDRGVLVVDRSSDAMVSVAGDKVREMTAPTRLTGAQLPDRTVGELAVVTVPQGRSMIAIGDVGDGRPVRRLGLPDGGGTAVPFAGRIYVPDEGSGRVRVFTEDGTELEPIRVPRAQGELELVVREQRLFVNAVDSPTALVVNESGKVSAVEKYGPGSPVPDPTASGGVPSESPSPAGPSSAAPAPSTPGPQVPGPDAPGSESGEEDGDPPGAPVPVTVLAGDGQVRVSWGRAGGSAVDRYLVTWNGGRTEVDGDELSTVVTGLRNGQSYRFRVVARNEFGTGPPALSEPVVPTAAAPPAPQAPTAAAAAGRVTVTWPAVDGAREYVVTPLRNGDPGNDPRQTVRGTSAEFEGLTFGARYTFTVVARNAGGGASAASPPSNAVVPFSRPGAPPGVTARQVSQAEYRITWQAAAQNGRPVQRYVVRDSAGRELDETDGAARGTTVSSAAELTRVSVTAVNAAGEGPARSVAVTPLPAVSVTITDVNPGAETVVVLFDVTNPGGGELTCTTSAGGESVNDCDGRADLAGLSPATRYTARVTVRAGGQTDEATRGFTTSSASQGDVVGWVVCEVCEDEVPHYAEPSTSSEVRGYLAHGTEITAVCQTPGEFVDATDKGGTRSSVWIRKPDDNYLPYAHIDLDDEASLSQVPRC
uniref:Fibronectin type III domain protein n=1 Tax=uncultured bacterium AZ_40 TaxID=1630016 RepID=A0A0E3M0B6_9BACT|nr:fibronectin type III domain protein [uncultured bacterium AZ_40]